MFAISLCDDVYLGKKDSMKEYIRLMKALSDPNRVRVLKLLQEKELCVCEIQALLGLAQSTTSKHMKLLEDAGLVDSRKEGSWLIYCIGGASDTACLLLDNLSDQFTDDQALQAMLLGMPQVLRDKQCVK